jgi:hypothetical protein
MAGFAGGIGEFSVKACVVADVVRDFFVAVETLFAERLLVERHVTFLAIRLVLGVI